MVSSCPDSDIFVSSVGMCRPAAQFTCDDKGNTGSSGSAELCGDGKTYGPYTDDCSAFVVCANNEVRKCLNGYLFDIKDSVCRPASSATCYQGSGDDIPQYVKLECASLDFGSIVPHRNCQKYYICDGANIEVGSCPPGKHFSRAYNGCVSILRAGCRALGTVCVAQSINYTFPALQCQDYYTCPANGSPIRNSCPDNNVYNPNTDYCVPSSTYDCNDDIVIPGPSTIEPPTESPNPGDHRCSTISSGTKVANAEDCHKYFMCNNGQAIPLVCATGQYFDEKNQLCSTSNPSC